MYKIKQILSVFLIIIMCFEIAEPVSAKTKTPTYALFVTNVKFTQNGNKLTVEYTAKKHNQLINCEIGYEDFSGYEKKSQSIGKAGKHKITWTVASPVYRVYAVIKARNYTDKDIIKTFYNVKTGTTYHTVTKKEDRNNKIGICVASTIISLSGYVLPPTKILQVGITIGGIAFGVISSFSYNPTAGDYIVTKTSFNSKKRLLTTSISIYNSKASYKYGDKPKVKWSGNTNLNFKY